MSRLESEPKTQVMGILNVTPDSFYDGGRYEAVEDATTRAETMVNEGANVIDVGGESTSPGSDPTPVDEELERVIPVIEHITDLDVPISIDSRRPRVARQALNAGAEIINDQSGLADPKMRELAAERDCQVIIMDSANLPVDPSSTPDRGDAVVDIKSRLEENIQQALSADIAEENIIVDPGIGFGTTNDEDKELITRINEVGALGYPVLIGCSRKSFLASILDLPEEQRLEMSLAAHTIAAVNGADIVRTHDVKETIRAVRVGDALAAAVHSND